MLAVVLVAMAAASCSSDLARIPHGPGLIRITSYNPMSLVRPGRQSEILSRLHHSNIIAMQGTCTAPVLHNSFVQWHDSGFIVTTWPYSKHGRGSNNKCGVSVALRTDMFKPQFVRRVFSPGADLAGRAGGQHIRSLEVLTRTGDELQLVTRSTRVDHRPVSIKLHYRC